MITAVSLSFVPLNVAITTVCVPALAHLHWAGMKADNEAIDRAFPRSFVRRDAITAENVAAYEAALAAAKDESAMQRILEANPCLLVQHLAGGSGAWVIPQKQLGSEHVTDFLIAVEDSGGFVWVAVELERPQAKIFTVKGDPAFALTHALRQINDWRSWLSRNLDYATRPRHQSGHSLIDIEPELDGLIILGRDSDLDLEKTSALRKRLERDNRVRIRTYDWLASQARERLAAAERARASVTASQQSVLGSLMDTFFSQGWSRSEDLVKKTISKAFGGITEALTNPSATREIEYEAVAFPFGCGEDKTIEVPLCIVRARPEGELLEPYDWKDWIDYVGRDLSACYSLLVTEKPPAEDLQDALTMEHEGVWYDAQWLNTSRKEQLSRLDVLAYLPPASGYTERTSRLTTAREIIQRHIKMERERELEQEIEAELKVASLSLAPGDAVTHDKFGFGTVQSLHGSGAETEATIDFGSEFGIKHLILRYAPLKKL
jgi:hypothetical protein